jgi:hypothetical protein
MNRKRGLPSLLALEDENCSISQEKEVTIKPFDMTLPSSVARADPAKEWRSGVLHAVVDK